jgi:peptide/nickel transport system substrate-binding protein
MARSETDEAKRKEQYWEAQRLLQDDGGAIVAMWASFIHAHSKGLAHDEAGRGQLAERWQQGCRALVVLLISGVI